MFAYCWNFVLEAVGGSAARIQRLTIFGSILMMLAYPIIMETLTRGRTVGALAAGCG